MTTEQEWADHERDLAHEDEHEEAMSEPDDLITAVRAWLRKLDTRLIASKQPETDTLAVILEDLPCTVVDWLRALLARCEAAEDERDAARAEVARLREFADEVRLQMDASEPQPRSGQQVGPRAEAWQIAPSTRKYRRLLAALDTPAREGGEGR